jgi:hypothetical protein
VTSGVDQLTQHQRDLLEDWFPGAEVAKDHSWGLVGTTVVELVHDGACYIVKAGDESDHHMARELRAHRHWLEPWTSRGRAPHLVYADDDAKLLATLYLPGELVEGGDHAFLPDTYRQAGRLLARLHEQVGVEDEDFEARENEKALVWLERSHRIASNVVGTAARRGGVVANTDGHPGANAR